METSATFVATIVLSCISAALLLASLYLVFRPPNQTNLNVVSVHRGWGSFALSAGCFLSFGGVWSLYYGTNGHPPNSLMEGISVSLMGMAFIGLMMPSFTRWHEVIWDETYLEGPNRLFGPTLRFSRTKIKWDDIAEVGQTFTMYKFVKNLNGDVIYYSPYSSGLETFESKVWQCFSENS